MPAEFAAAASRAVAAPGRCEDGRPGLSRPCSGEHRPAAVESVAVPGLGEFGPVPLPENAVDSLRRAKYSSQPLSR